MVDYIMVLAGAAVAFGIGAIGVGWVVGIYNNVKTAVQDIKGMWANILTEYQRRADLYCNLARSIKASTKFEKETLTEVIKLRNQGFGSTKKEQAANMKEMDGLLSKLMVVVEQYPQLQSTKQFEQFNEEAVITEDRINAARTEYNKIVEDYNTFLTVFPNSAVCNWFDFKQEKFFEASDYAMKKPEVEL